MIHYNNHPADTGNEIHRATHALDQFTRNHPVRQIAVFRDFHRAEDRHIDLTTADHREGLVATEIGRAVHLGYGLLTGID